MQPFFAEVLPGGPIAVEAPEPQPAALPAQAPAMDSQELLSIIAGALTLRISCLTLCFSCLTRRLQQSKC